MVFGIGSTSVNITIETVDNNVVDCSKSFEAVLSIPSSGSGLCVVAGEFDVAEIAIVDNEEGTCGILFVYILYVIVLSWHGE